MAKHSAVDPDEPTTKSEQTRKRLREGAMASFSELGFHGTGTRHIATAAGMSPAAVYVHYSSKEELLFEISLAGHEAILRIVRDAAAGTDDPVEQLRRFIREFAMYHADRHVSARVVNYELCARWSTCASRSKTCSRRSSTAASTRESSTLPIRGWRQLRSSAAASTWPVGSATAAPGRRPRWPTSTRTPHSA